MQIISTSSLAFVAAMATVVNVNAQAPDCKTNPENGYKNCKNGHYVSGSGSDVLWCKTESDCDRVFGTESTSPGSNGATVDALEKAQVVASSSTLKTTAIGGAVVAASMMMAIESLC